MPSPKFAPPNPNSPTTPTSNLYVANCGPAVGLSFDSIASVFRKFGNVTGVYAADDTGTRVVVAFEETSCAENALKTLDGRKCEELKNRMLRVRYSVHRTTESVGVNDTVPVALDASELNIPGIYLLHNFISAKEEEELLAAIDERPWRNLAKRRVQHYGYEFCYDIRNVNTKCRLGELPSFVSYIRERIKSSPDITHVTEMALDQLTINEYPPGVGLSPHIDTHSAFEEPIFSLSLAGPCIMEFRRYSDGGWNSPASSVTDMKEKDSSSANYIRKAIYLPPRCLLLLSGEGRYAWHHYIPHHKIDKVNDTVIKRGSRRVSFTFRKVRTNPCQCEHHQYCDSQRHEN